MTSQLPPFRAALARYPVSEAPTRVLDFNRNIWSSSIETVIQALRCNHDKRHGCPRSQREQAVEEAEHVERIITPDMAVAVLLQTAMSGLGHSKWP